MINKTQNIHRKMCSSKSTILLLHLEMYVKEGMKNNLQFIIYLDQCQAFCSLLLRPKAKCCQSLLVILPYTILLWGASKKKNSTENEIGILGSYDWKIRPNKAWNVYSDSDYTVLHFDYLVLSLFSCLFLLLSLWYLESFYFPWNFFWKFSLVWTKSKVRKTDIRWGKV